MNEDRKIIASLLEVINNDMSCDHCPAIGHCPKKKDKTNGDCNEAMIKYVNERISDGLHEYEIDTKGIDDNAIPTNNKTEEVK